MKVETKKNRQFYALYSEYRKLIKDLQISQTLFVWSQNKNQKDCINLKQNMVYLKDGLVITYICFKYVWKNQQLNLSILTNLMKMLNFQSEKWWILGKGPILNHLESMCSLCLPYYMSCQTYILLIFIFKTLSSSPSPIFLLSYFTMTGSLYFVLPKKFNIVFSDHQHNSMDVLITNK